MSDIQVGDSATREFVVGDEDTATALGSGDVPVLGTPRAIAWAESVTVAAVAERLDDNETTVGSRVCVEHVLASQVGETVVATALVAEVDRRRVQFEVTLVNRDGRTALSGSVQRVVVDREGFLASPGE